MNYTALMFSVLFFVVFSVYMFFSIYILHLNPKAALNRAFYIVCVALCFWSLGFSLSVNAPDANTAGFFRRFSVIGWSFIYVAILQFLLILTDSKNIKKSWFRLLLYIPSFYCLVVFALFDQPPFPGYTMLLVDFGWINTTAISGWDIPFYMYYVGYIIASLLVVWRWRSKNTDPTIRRQANLILISFSVALLMGTFTDVVLASARQPMIPQLGPIIILLPVSVFYYLIQRYGLMRSEPVSGYQLIMNEATRARLYQTLSVIFTSASVLSFLYEYSFTHISAFETALMKAAVLLIIGILFFFIQRIRSDSLQYAFNMFLVLLSIPAITLLYLNHGAYISWAFPTVLMVVALVFNKRSMLIAVTSTTIIVQLLIWIYTADIPYQPSNADYVVRIYFFIVLLLVGLYVNSIYLSKLKENAEQIELQKMISEISYNFARVDRTNIDQNIIGLLEKISSHYHADRCFVFLFDREQNLINLKYEWCQPGVPSELELFKPCPIDKYQSLIDRMTGNVTLYHKDVRELPPELIENSDLLFNKNITSMLSAPLESGGFMYGFLGFTSGFGPMNITDVTLEILQTFANLIADKLKMIKADENIEYLAYYDQLTGLPNRVLFADRVNQAIHLAARQEKLLGIVYIDLNSFNAVNDTFGHGSGDAILNEIAFKLKHHLRKTDTVARFGGDDFLVLLSDMPDGEAISTVARNLMNLFHAPIRLRDQEFFITANAGIAVYPIDGEDSETLIKNADLAMYKAKASGFNRFVLCTDDMKEEVRLNMLLSNSLYRSLERGELSVQYQPQIRLDTEKVIGVEALMRWHHPTLGMISPGVFIPLAEKNGLIGSLGEWVLRTACVQNKKWQDMGYPRCRISVNLSVVQLRNPRLPEIVADILEETGLSPSDLELEITESAAMEEANSLSAILKQLKKLGLSISIDDFGTEYSSLHRLRELPIDRLKIDIQFIRALENSEKDQAITMTIISLAKNLGLQVVAEGVETLPQLDFLRSKDCDEVQGFYYYKPMTPEDIERTIF